MLPDKGKAKEKVHPRPLYTDRPACFLLPSSLYKEQEWHPPLPLFFPVSKSLIKPHPCTNPGSPSLITTTEQAREKRDGNSPERTRSNRASGGLYPLEHFRSQGPPEVLGFHQGTEPYVHHTPLGSSIFPNPLTTHELTVTYKSYLSKSFPGGNWQCLYLAWLPEASRN